MQVQLPLDDSTFWSLGAHKDPKTGLTPFRCTEMDVGAWNRLVLTHEDDREEYTVTSGVTDGRYEQGIIPPGLQGKQFLTPTMSLQPSLSSICPAQLNVSPYGGMFISESPTTQTRTRPPNLSPNTYGPRPPCDTTLPSLRELPGRNPSETTPRRELKKSLEHLRLEIYARPTRDSPPSAGADSFFESPPPSIRPSPYQVSSEASQWGQVVQQQSGGGEYPPWSDPQQKSTDDGGWHQNIPQLQMPAGTSFQSPPPSYRPSPGSTPYHQVSSEASQLGQVVQQQSGGGGYPPPRYPQQQSKDSGDWRQNNPQLQVLDTSSPPPPFRGVPPDFTPDQGRDHPQPDVQYSTGGGGWRWGEQQVPDDPAFFQPPHSSDRARGGRYRGRWSRGNGGRFMPPSPYPPGNNGGRRYEPGGGGGGGGVGMRF